MFDVFDIQLPKLAGGAGLAVRARESAFGPSDDEFVYVEGVEFAKVVLASKAYTNVEAWTGSSDGTEWTVQVVARTANDAATTDESWAAFIERLVAILNAHSFWRIICESDCDQYPRETMRQSPVELGHHLDSLRQRGASPIALEVVPS